MSSRLLIVVFAAIVALASAYTLPQLNTIVRGVSLTPYSCSGSYDTSALFLSDYSKMMNGPDLLYDGFCTPGSSLTFTSDTAGDDFSALSYLLPPSLSPSSSFSSLLFSSSYYFYINKI